MESQLESLLSKVTNKHMMKSKSIMNGNQVEITYEVRMKKDQSQVVNNVTNLSGVESAVMLSYDGNFTA